MLMLQKEMLKTQKKKRYTRCKILKNLAESDKHVKNVELLKKKLIH